MGWVAADKFTVVLETAGLSATQLLILTLIDPDNPKDPRHQQGSAVIGCIGPVDHARRLTRDQGHPFRLVTSPTTSGAISRPAAPAPA